MYGNGFDNSTLMIFSLNPLLFSEGDEEETAVVQTKGAEVKGDTGRGTETLPIRTGSLTNCSEASDL